MALLSFLVDAMPRRIFVQVRAKKRYSLEHWRRHLEHLESLERLENLRQHQKNSRRGKRPRRCALKPEVQTILKRNIQLLIDNPIAQIHVAGYTSASGTEAYNQKLSERRANCVEEYLINEGIITRGRLSTIGYGETNPAMYEAASKELYSKAAKANMRALFEIIVQ